MSLTDERVAQAATEEVDRDERGAEEHPGDADEANDQRAPEAASEEMISLREARKLRRENQNLRRRLEELKRAQEEAKLTELERLQRRLEEESARARELEEAKRQIEARYAVLARVVEMGARRPEAIYRLIRDELEFDQETGELTNLDELLRRARRDYPELFGYASVDASATGGAAGRTDMNALIRRALRTG